MSNQASGGGEAMPFSGVGLTPDEETKVRAAALEPGDEELLVDWAHTIRMESTMLELVLAGYVKARINEQGEVAVSLTEAGTKYVQEKLLAGERVAVEVEAPK